MGGVWSKLQNLIPLLLLLDIGYMLLENRNVTDLTLLSKFWIIRSIIRSKSWILVSAGWVLWCFGVVFIIFWLLVGLLVARNSKFFSWYLPCSYVRVALFVTLEFATSHGCRSLLSRGVSECLMLM